MKKLYIILAMGFFMLSACVTQTLDECPPDPAPASETGDATVRVYVEQFGVNAEALRSSRAIAELSEERFNYRIENLDYYLYKEGKLIEQGAIDGVSDISGPYYTFYRDDLEPGEYKLALLANCVQDVLQGSPENPEELTIVYPGYDKTADYFTAMIPFTVVEGVNAPVEGQLQRVHGVVRFTFNNMGDDIHSIGIELDGLTSSSCIMGTYSQGYCYTNKLVKIATSRAYRQPSLVGLFPTATGGVSHWNLSFYTDEGEIAAYNMSMPDDLYIVRNQLLDLSAELKDGRVVFSANLVADWEDPREGGSTIIE